MRTQEPGIREQVLNFGPYQLFRAQKMLVEGGKQVRLGSRAMDILIALVERAGEVVTKNELMSYAWPHTCVEESNLRVHVARIRKILGDGQDGVPYIVNAVGRGYSFVAPVTRVDAKAPSPAVEQERAFRLPQPSTRILGRHEVIQAIGLQIRRKRLVNIVGPAGVGKTTVALALGEQLLEAYGRRVCFVDLATLEDPAGVPLALATVMGISALAEDPLASVVAYLRSVRMLLILDNCEHVVSAAAHLVEVLLNDAPEVTVLATSREPLLVRGEYICNLEPLRHPPENAGLSAEAAMSFPAVQLFVERAMVGSESFELTDANVDAVTAICRQVDGIPLAIELIAARTNLFGAEVLGEHQRTGEARHQSLRATLDWSYRTLATVEQFVLRRLSVFRGSFTAESVAAVAIDAAIDRAEALEALTSLVSKSLVMTDVDDRSIRYRLLHVTRIYALEKLTESQERSGASRAHAIHIRTVLEGALGEWERVTRDEWLGRHGSVIDDVRAALDWAFGENGNVELGAALTVASLPFGFQLSLIDEIKTRAQQALEILHEFLPAQPLWEIRIGNGLTSLLLSTGAPAEVVDVTLSRVQRLAEQSGNPQLLIEPYNTCAILHLEAGDYASAVTASEVLRAAARQTDDALANLMADRVGAQIYYSAGQFSRSRSLAERVLRHPARSLPLAYNQAPIDRRVSMRNVLALNLWIQGCPDQADTVIAEGIELAETDGPATLCQSLGIAGVPIAFWRGDMEAALRRTEDLLDYSRRYTFKHWYRLGMCYQQTLNDRMTLVGHEGEGASSGVLPASTFQRDVLSTISPLWLDPQQSKRAQARLCGFATAEVLRACGEVQLDVGDPSALARAEACFNSSLEVARQQQALSWELRSVMSLAELWQRGGRVADAYLCLKSVYDRFNEGHATADLIKARLKLTEFESSACAPPTPRPGEA